MQKHKMIKSLTDIIILLVSAFLFLSAVYIYVSNRSGDMILYSWLGVDYNNHFFEWIRDHSCRLAPWVKYNLPDGLWMLSFLLFLEGVWGNEKKLKWMFCVPIIVFAFIMEILQYNGCFPGTGDIIDIVFYIAAILLFLLLTNLKQKCYEKNN